MDESAEGSRIAILTGGPYFVCSNYSSNPAYPHPPNDSSYLLMPGTSSHMAADGFKGFSQIKYRDESLYAPNSQVLGIFGALVPHVRKRNQPNSSGEKLSMQPAI
ncbi:hypothetical protein MKW98_032756 [Papaver atlanticum]|uniref:Uncharacterized protein n=1 Tax=Papaver atlanticum TaxID=357466 RepID=A0AAD4S0Q0_9MAGN|nr:hypothetical protein MKW98_032756 [Papaver atlanticum]